MGGKLRASVPEDHHPEHAGDDAGALIRHERRAQGLTLAQLGARAGYSAAQVSRYERGRSPLTDIDVLRRFADALGLPPRVLGISPTRQHRHGRQVSPVAAYPRLPAPRVSGAARGDGGDDPVRRRRLLANLATTATAAAGSHLLAAIGEPASRTEDIGVVLLTRLRDAMLGLHADDPVPTPAQLRAEFVAALTDFHACRYSGLAVRLPRLLRAGHALSDDDQEHAALLAHGYLLTTRILIKLDDQQLGWLGADRARQFAEASAQPLVVAEAARNLAVLARKAGWHGQALSIALAAADHPDLASNSAAHLAERGLLIQSAAYTAARSNDQQGMRELTNEADALAARCGSRVQLRDHGGGFSPATVQLHRISAENWLGDPAAALEAARNLPPGSLPSVERRARYYTDLATAHARRSNRDDCLHALLHAETQAPEETRARPAVKTLVSGLLMSGRNTPDLRGLAARVGVPF